MTAKNVTIDPEILARVGQVAEAEGRTVDELATEAVKRDLARRWLERTRREGEARCAGMTDDEVESVVDEAVHQSRAEQRSL